jgi:murein DD-endopeptidase MepM/ murein hydrolase activator NlpD
MAAGRRRGRFPLPVLAAAVLVAAGGAACRSSAPPATAAPRADINLPLIGTVVSATVPRNATLESLLLRHETPAHLVAPVIMAVRSVFDPRRVRADQPYQITSSDGEIREFRYQIDRDQVLRVAAGEADDGEPAFEAEIVEIPRRVEVDALTVEISAESPSLVGALEAAGENIELGLVLAEILGGEVDFNTELQPGDTIEVLFDRVIREDSVTSYGDVKAALMRNGDREISAIRYVAADGRAGWYDRSGRSLKRQFLRSPLAFSRVTSGFSLRRFHPVHRTYRPHLGVDYGAPTGTPVRAVAAGTVEFAGFNGEAGRMVRLRHAGGYQTLYLHLSALGPGIRAGARVSQEQVIGRVGMTGTATAPHLDYRMIKNGRYVNPIAELNRMPKGDPIPTGALDAFAAERDAFLEDLRQRLAQGSGS